MIYFKIYIEIINDKIHELCYFENVSFLLTNNLKYKVNNIQFCKYIFIVIFYFLNLNKTSQK